MSRLSINEWAEEDRPREKLQALGAECLSNAELLAILIGSGSTDESAVALMKRIMKGMGPAKAITILAACELGKRRQKTQVEERRRLSSPQDIYEYMHPTMQDLDVEEAWVLLLNQGFRLIKPVRLSHGGISETAVDIRLIMKEAIVNNATVIALCHNHPSNNLFPSRNDDNLTRNVKKACETMRIHFLDHVIVTDGAYYSYNEKGRL